MALDTISTISKCITVVSIEKQKTAQVKATMKAKIEVSKQETERVKIQEKEETKRLVASCEKDLKKNELVKEVFPELEKLRYKYEYKSREREVSHNEYTETLDLLEKQVDDIMKDKELLRRIIVEDSASLQIETFLHSLNEANIKLVEISNQIVALRGNK